MSYLWDFSQNHCFILAETSIFPHMAVSLLTKKAVLNSDVGYHYFNSALKDTPGTCFQEFLSIFVRVTDAHLFMGTFLSFCLSVCLSVESISHKQSKWIEAIDSSFESPSTLVDTSR